MSRNISELYSALDQECHLGKQRDFLSLNVWSSFVFRISALGCNLLNLIAEDFAFKEKV